MPRKESTFISGWVCGSCPEGPLHIRLHLLPRPGGLSGGRPSQHQGTEKGSCAFKNTRVHPTRAVRRGTREGGAGFVNGRRAEGVGKEGEGQRGGTSPGHAAAELKSALPPPKVSGSLRSVAVEDSPSAPDSLQEVGRGSDAGGPTLTPKTLSSQLCRHAPLSGFSAALALQQQSYPGAAPGPTRGFERCRGHTSRVVPGLPSPNMECGPGRGPQCRWRFGPKIAAPPPVFYPPSSHRSEAKGHQALRRIPLR